MGGEKKGDDTQWYGRFEEIKEVNGDPSSCMDHTLERDRTWRTAALVTKPLPVTCRCRWCRKGARGCCWDEATKHRMDDKKENKDPQHTYWASARLHACTSRILLADKSKSKVGRSAHLEGRGEIGPKGEERRLKRPSHHRHHVQEELG